MRHRRLKGLEQAEPLFKAQLRLLNSQNIFFPVFFVLMILASFGIATVDVHDKLVTRYLRDNILPSTWTMLTFTPPTWTMS